MKKLFAALAFCLVLLLAVTAEAWAATLTGWLLAGAGLAMTGLCARAAAA